MNLVILGAGGQGRETLEIAKAIIKDGKTSYNFKIDKVIGFLDEKHVSSNDPLSGFAEKIIGTTADSMPSCAVVAAVFQAQNWAYAQR